ncbi:hypothetical protein LTR85_011425 [Meristemomyces frigidus]|nr:hypothetical protein LTR85_011425 [Meristemomyces frigidus]
MSTTTDDLPWQQARTTTKDDLDKFGNVDDWLHNAVEPIAAGAPTYSDQWSFFMFWINDIRYADRKGQGNTITTGESQNFKNARETRTVVESGPTLVASGTPLTTPGASNEQIFTNDTSSDFSRDYVTTLAQGTKSTISVSHQTQLTVGATVTIGPFSVNASGSLTDEQAKSTESDETTTTQTTFTINVSAGKKVKATTTTSTTTRTDVYEMTISLRAKNGVPSIGVPPAGGNFDSLGLWYALKDLPGIGPLTTQKAEFQLTQVTTRSDFVEEEKDLNEPFDSGN